MSASGANMVSTTEKSPLTAADHMLALALLTSVSLEPRAVLGLELGARLFSRTTARVAAGRESRVVDSNMFLRTTRASGAPTAWRTTQGTKGSRWVYMFLLQQGSYGWQARELTVSRLYCLFWFREQYYVIMSREGAQADLTMSGAGLGAKPPSNTLRYGGQVAWSGVMYRACQVRGHPSHSPRQITGVTGRYSLKNATGTWTWDEKEVGLLLQIQLILTWCRRIGTFCFYWKKLLFCCTDTWPCSCFSLVIMMLPGTWWTCTCSFVAGAFHSDLRSGRPTRTLRTNNKARCRTHL